LGPRRRLPRAHLLVLFDAPAGFRLQTLPAPLRTHALSRAALRHRALASGDRLRGTAPAARRRSWPGCASGSCTGRSEAAGRLSPPPPAAAREAGRPGASRSPSFALAEAPGKTRSTGGVFHAGPAPRVAAGCGLRPAARGAGGARGALPGSGARPARAGGDAGHDLAGCPVLRGAGAGEAVRAALAGGDGSA